MKNHLLRRWALFALLPAALLQTAAAADSNAGPNPPPGTVANTNFSLSAATARRAPWQEHLTLGPGDTLNFALFLNDAASEARLNVVIAPDGRVSYLQAQDIMAAGLTIDELRAKMDAELGKYYRSPHTIVTPGAVRSKKYFVLGAVVNTGVFTLDRPTTLIEAMARAGGFETGVFERNTVEIADLSHSFLVRQGNRVPLDFEKLFQQGDLSQNVPLEPNDYLYIASSTANDIYVLGQVQLPGIMPYLPKSTVLGAIISRGGYTTRAFKARVLVIRGSLKNPETFIVDTSDILSGKIRDFELKPRDIVYVATKPWAKVQELLDEGTRSFIEAVVVTYSGTKIGPFIDPIIH